MRLTRLSVLFILVPLALEPLVAQSPNSGGTRLVPGAQFSPRSATRRGCPCRNQTRIPVRTTLVPTPVAVSWTEAWRVGMHRFLGRLIGNVEEVDARSVGHSARRVDSRLTRLRSQAIFNQDRPPTTQVPARQQWNRVVASAPQLGRNNSSRVGTDQGTVLRWVPVSERERASGTRLR